jgi:hypothetical protein
LPRRGSRVQVSSPAPFRITPAAIDEVHSGVEQFRLTAWPKARYPSGKGEVCKTFMRRFDPGPRLQLLQQLSDRLTQGSLIHCVAFVGTLCTSAPYSPALGHCEESLESGNLLFRIEALYLSCLCCRHTRLHGFQPVLSFGIHFSRLPVILPITCAIGSARGSLVAIHFSFRLEPKRQSLFSGHFECTAAMQGALGLNAFVGATVGPPASDPDDHGPVHRSRLL